MGLFGSLCVLMGSYGPLCTHMGAYGPTLYRFLWVPMGSYAFL